MKKKLALLLVLIMTLTTIITPCSVLLAASVDSSSNYYIRDVKKTEVSKNEMNVSLFIQDSNNDDSQFSFDLTLSNSTYEIDELLGKDDYTFDFDTTIYVNHENSSWNVRQIKYISNVKYWEDEGVSFASFNIMESDKTVTVNNGKSIEYEVNEKGTFDGPSVGIIGSTINITNYAFDGYKCVGVYYDDGVTERQLTASGDGYSFVMPNGDVRVYALYEEDGINDTYGEWKTKFFSLENGNYEVETEDGNKVVKSDDDEPIGFHIYSSDATNTKEGLKVSSSQGTTLYLGAKDGYLLAGVKVLLGAIDSDGTHNGFYAQYPDAITVFDNYELSTEYKKYGTADIWADDFGYVISNDVVYEWFDCGSDYSPYIEFYKTKDGKQEVCIKSIEVSYVKTEAHLVNDTKAAFNLSGNTNNVEIKKVKLDNCQTNKAVTVEYTQPANSDGSRAIVYLQFNLPEYDEETIIPTGVYYVTPGGIGLQKSIGSRYGNIYSSLVGIKNERGEITNIGFITSGKITVTKDIDDKLEFTLEAINSYGKSVVVKLTSSSIDNLNSTITVEPNDESNPAIKTMLVNNIYNGENNQSNTDDNDSKDKYNYGNETTMYDIFISAFIGMIIGISFAVIVVAIVKNKSSRNRHYYD